jgi:negative regulator of flagellin synthesis FlgM
MRVGNHYGQAVQNSEAQKSKKTEDAAKVGTALKTEKPVTDSTDAGVEISDRAKEMAQAKQAAQGAPDIREAKIAELKKRIAAKQYNVKPEDIADKMVREHAQTKDIS